MGTLRKVTDIKKVIERKSKESVKVAADNKVEKLAKVFGETMKLVKERGTESDRERKRAKKESYKRKERGV